MIRKGITLVVMLLFIGMVITPLTVSSEIEQYSVSTFNDGSLSGYVNDTSMNPIEGALVRVYFHGTYEENYTDSSGHYRVINIPICNCTKNCTASKEGYKTKWVLLGIDENTTYDFVLTPYGWIFNGTMGENGWYISPVTVTFIYPPLVKEVWYMFNTSGWILYTEPFVIYEQGGILFYYKWLDIMGNWTAGETIIIKIDYTPPKINLLKDIIRINKVKFIANVMDETSGVNRVEFYIDDELQETVSSAPYNWIYEGIIINLVSAVVYDNAGNFAGDFFHPYPFDCRCTGIILNPEFTEQNVTFFAVIVLSNYGGVGMFQPLTFPNDYKGYIGRFFIRATFNTW